MTCDDRMKPISKCNQIIFDSDGNYFESPQNISQEWEKKEAQIKSHETLVNRYSKCDAMASVVSLLFYCFDANIVTVFMEIMLRETAR